MHFVHDMRYAHDKPRRGYPKGALATGARVASESELETQPRKGLSKGSVSDRRQDGIRE